MYNDLAMEEDRKMAESWKSVAGGILVFVGSSISLDIPLPT